MSEPIKVCLGCDHPISRHVNNVSGVALCLVVDTGVSSKGVIGIPWEHPCDCENFVSEKVNYRRKREAQERERMLNAVDRIVNKFGCPR
jgi:hypothetical protein